MKTKLYDVFFNDIFVHAIWAYDAEDAIKRTAGVDVDVPGWAAFTQH